MSSYARYSSMDFEAILRIANVISRLGLGRSIATILAALLIRGPLTQSEIASLTGYSVSSVSSSLSVLERLGLVTAIKKSGRKRLYSVVGSFIDLVERLLEDYVYHQLASTVKFLERNISKFNSRSKRNIEKIVNEYRRLRGELVNALRT